MHLWEQHFGSALDAIRVLYDKHICGECPHKCFRDWGLLDRWGFPYETLDCNPFLMDCNDPPHDESEVFDEIFVMYIYSTGQVYGTIFKGKIAFVKDYGCEAVRNDQFLFDLPDALMDLDTALCGYFEGGDCPCKECSLKEDEILSWINMLLPSKDVGVPCTWGVDCPRDMELKIPSYDPASDKYVSLFEYINIMFGMGPFDYHTDSCDYLNIEKWSRELVEEEL
jgi:hypothetical protein